MQKFLHRALSVFFWPFSVEPNTSIPLWNPFNTNDATEIKTLNAQ